MYSIEKYEKNLRYLTNSLVIKLLDVAASMNKGVINLGYSVSENKNEWKYFLNISGKKHITNTDVKITVIETGNIESLSIELLEQYPYTKSELFKQDKYYEALIENYPNDTLFIKGCMYPCDIDTAINAPDGSILAYDKNLVEISEYRLIDELEGFIKRFLARWNVRTYALVDNLYVPALVGILYTNIPNQITAIRISKLNTSEVHSFFLEHFFRSNGDMWEDVQVLNKQTIYWLYRNLKYLRKHIGKHSTLNTILNKVFDPNKFGVGVYNIKIPDPVINIKYKDDIDKSYHIRKEPVAISNSLNKSFTDDNIETKTIEELIKLQEQKHTRLPAETDNDIITYDINTVKNKIVNQTYNTTYTKTLTLSTIKLFDINNVDILNFILDYWVYAIKHNLLPSVVDYAEPNNNMFYVLTPKQGLLFLIKQLLFVTNNTGIKLNNITHHNVISSDIARYDAIVENSYDDGYSKSILDIIKDNLPETMPVCKNVDMFKDYLLDSINFNGLVWTLDSNSENALVSMNIKNVISKMMITDTLDLTVNNVSYTIDELIEFENKKYLLEDGYDIYKSISTLVYSFTGLDIDPYMNIRNRLSSLSNILNKLTSYTLQCIKPDTEKDEIPVYYNNIQNIKAKNALVKCLDAILVPLELNYVHIKALANDFKDRFNGFHFTNQPMVGVCSKPINGIAWVEDDKEFNIEYMVPRTKIQIYNDVICDAKYVEYKDEFILSVNSELIANEPFIGITESGMSTDDDSILGFNTNQNYPGILSSRKDIIGIGSIDDDNEFSIDYQNSGMKITIVEDTTGYDTVD